MSNLPRSSALRKGRASLPGQVYLITCVTRDRQQRFASFERACAASAALTRPALWVDARLLAWVLMPDHMHLLVELGDKENLSLVAQRCKAVLSTTLRPYLGHEKLWQPGYHDHALRRTENVRHAARYLIANPLRAGLVERIGDYPFWDAVWLGPDHDTLDP